MLLLRRAREIAMLTTISCLMSPQSGVRISADQSGSVHRSSSGRSDAVTQPRMATAVLTDVDLVPYHRTAARTLQAHPNPTLKYCWLCTRSALHVTDSGACNDRT